MTHRGAPCRIREHLSIQEIGMETLVYDERRHLAFCLNQSSSVIWHLANGERSISEIGAAASLELKNPVSDELVLFALKELQRDGLVQRVPTADGAHAISRRILLRKIGAASAMLLPIVSAVVAPTAAQAYGGCVDCSSSQVAKPRKRPPPAAPSQ